MKKNQKTAAILVSNEDNASVTYAVGLLKKNNMNVSTFSSSESLYLYLVTRTPSIVFVSTMLDRKILETVMMRLEKEYKVQTCLFEESESQKITQENLDQLNLSSSDKSVLVQKSKDGKQSEIHIFKGENLAAKILKEEGRKNTSKAHLIIAKRDGIVDASKKRIEKNGDGKVIHLKKNETQESGSVKVIDKSNNKTKNIKSNIDDGFNYSDLVSALGLDNKELETLENNYYVLPIQSEEMSGYLIVDGEISELKSKLIQEYPDKLDMEKVFKVELHRFKDIKSTFIGSMKKKGLSFNLYFIQSKVPDVRIVKKEDKISVSAQHFKSDETINFDLYLYLEHNKKHYQYLSGGNSLSKEQLLKLTTKNKDLSINQEDKDKLMSLIHLEGFKKEA